MSENLINIINELNLEALKQATQGDGGKEELPEILRDFQEKFHKPPKYLKNSTPDEEFNAKLELLLGFYAGYRDQQAVYLALRTLEREQRDKNQRALELLEESMMDAMQRQQFYTEVGQIHTPSIPVSSPQSSVNRTNTLSSQAYLENYKIRAALQKVIRDRVSSQASSSKMDKLALRAMIGRIITPDQPFSAENSTNEQDEALFESQYNPLIPQNIKNTLEAFYTAIAKTLADNDIPFSKKLETLFLLYKHYWTILRSETEMFLYPEEMEGKSWLLENIGIAEHEDLKAFIQSKVKDGEEEFFTEEALKEELIASYLKMLFQYMGNKITFNIKKLEHPYKEILEITIFQTLSKIFEENRNIESLRDMSDKNEKLIERFKAELENKKNEIDGKLDDKKEELAEKIRALWTIADKKEYGFLQDAIRVQAGNQSAEEYMKVVFYLFDQKNASFLISKLNPQHLKPIIDADEDIKNLMEEARGIVNEIKRLQNCLIACDDAHKSMDILKSDNISAVSPLPATPSPMKGFLRMGRKKPGSSVTIEASTSSPAKAGSRFRVGRGLTRSTTSSLASASSAPVRETDSVILASPISAPVVSPDSTNPIPPSPTITSAPHTTFWAAHSSGNTTPTATTRFGQHRSGENSASASPVPAALTDPDVPTSIATAEEVTPSADGFQCKRDFK